MTGGSQPLRHLCFVADITGPAHYHVGDEAMLAANLALCRRLVPGLRAVITSADPAASSREHGVPAVPRLEFPDVSDRREAELARLDTEVAAALARRPAPPALEALSEADGLVISGGGNLCSDWPGLLLERLAMARLARRAGKPVIILGQTLGPWLSPVDRQLLRELLLGAAWVGVREATSYALALAMGVAPARLELQADDAAFLAEDAPEAPPLPNPPTILLTIAPFVDPDSTDPRLDALAQELAELAAGTKATLAFLPHANPAAPGKPGDLAMAEALRRRLAPTIELRVLPLSSARAAAALARQAALVVSSRYHPIVFGLAAGVPCLGLPVDEYTRVKLHGALAQLGQERQVFAMDQPDLGGLAAKALALFHDRASIGAELAAARPAWRQREAARHGRLAACLAGRPHGPAAPSEQAWAMEQAATTLLAAGEEIARLGTLATKVPEIDHLRLSQRAAEAYALDLKAHLDRCQAELAGSLAQADALREALAAPPAERP